MIGSQPDSEPEAAVPGGVPAPPLSSPLRSPLVPQIVAHRGASHENAEHTLAAYQRAIEVGAEALECDVRLTADGHLVCLHDRDVRRTTSTRGVVSTMNLAELDRLDYTSWKHPWADLDDDWTPPPTGVLQLRTLLETVAAAGRRVELAIETKHPTRYGGLVERKLAELLAEFGWTGPDAPVRVMSFSYRALERMARLTPDLQLVQLVEKAHHWPMLRQVVHDRWIIGPGIKELREHPGLGKHLRRAHREIHVWTVNTVADYQLCRNLGVTAVITDRPAMMLELRASQ